MRILLVTDSLRPDAGSAAHSLVGLVHGLKARGIHATLLAGDIAGAEELGFDATSVHPSHANDPLVVVGTHEVVHLFGWGYPLAQRTLAATKLARMPYAVSPLGAFDGLDKRRLGERLRWWLGDRRRVAGARCLLAMNEWELQALRDAKVHPRVDLLPLGGPFSPSEDGVAMMDTDRITKLDGPEQSQALTPNLSVATATPRPKGRGEPTPYILVLGPIDPPSGAVALLKALAELGTEADGWSVVFAGHLEPQWKQMLEAAVRRKGGEDRVRFINDPDLPTQQWLLRGCGMLVAPALRARPPIPLMQAVAAGVPACGTNCAAPAEVACITCRPNRSALRDMLRTMLRRSDAERRETAAKLANDSRHQLQWSSLIDRYIALYRGISDGATA